MPESSSSFLHLLTRSFKPHELQFLLAHPQFQSALAQAGNSLDAFEDLCVFAARLIAQNQPDDLNSPRIGVRARGSEE